MWAEFKRFPHLINSRISYLYKLSPLYLVPFMPKPTFGNSHFNYVWYLILFVVFSDCFFHFHGFNLFGSEGTFMPSRNSGTTPNLLNLLLFVIALYKRHF